MLANLYLHKDAVAYNGIDSKEQVMSKMRSFADDMRHVVYSYREENMFCVSCDIIACEVYEGISIVTLLKSILMGINKVLCTQFWQILQKNIIIQ